MQVRFRTQDMRTTMTGTYYNRLGTPQTAIRTALVGVTRTCDDVVGHTGHLFGGTQYLPNALTIVKTIRKVGGVNGEQYVTLPPRTLNKKFVNCPVGTQPNPPSCSAAWPAPSALQKSNYAYQIIGSTNPSTADISIPTFVGELKDVPGLVKDWGGSVVRQMAKSHLTWRWGIAPMIRDVRKMMTVISLVEKRVALLQRLQNGGVIRKRCSLGSYSYSDAPTNVVLHSEGIVIQATATLTYTSKVWGSAQWKLSSKALPLPKANSGMRKLAWKLVTGMTTWEAAATSWELLPWSWLADWFVSFGTLISAANHAIPAVWSNLCLMRTNSAKRTYEPKAGSPPNDWATVSDACSQEEIRKERYVGISPSAPLPLTLVPLIERKTWSILGSLAVLKGKPSVLKKHGYI